MTNTHFVDDDVTPSVPPEADPEPHSQPDPRAWPLEALATAPTRSLDALLPPPRQRRFRSVYPHEERVVQARIDARDEQGWG